MTRWEVGIGTYSSSTNTLSRDTVLDGSSGAGVKISLDGTSVVFVTYPAGRSSFLDESGDHRFDVSNSGSTLTITRTSSGNLIHAYIDNANDRTIGLYLEDNLMPTWKLGLKNSPSTATESPDQGYVYGNNGSVGMYVTSDTSSLINYSNGFWVTHKDSVLFNVDKVGGLLYDNALSSTVGITVRGAVSQSAHLQQWKNSADTVLSYVDSGGVITAPAINFSDGTSQTTSPKTGWRTYKSIIADATLLISDCVVFVDSSSESIEIALPTAAGNGGKEFIFKRTAGSNVVTINPYGSETIDGSSSFGIDNLYESVTAISNNSHWYLT